jgi:hypothetical protein
MHAAFKFGEHGKQAQGFARSLTHVGLGAAAAATFIDCKVSKNVFVGSNGVCRGCQGARLRGPFGGQGLALLANCWKTTSRDSL